MRAVECQVLSRLRFDGVLYEPGATVSLPEVEARFLAGDGVVDLPSAPDRQAEIAAAIDRLDPDDRALWTKDDRPQVAALEAALGYDITAAERDAAWEARDDR